MCVLFVGGVLCGGVLLLRFVSVWCGRCLNVAPVAVCVWLIVLLVYGCLCDAWACVFV